MGETFEPLPHQLPPVGPWKTWLTIGDRGIGKTAGMMHFASSYPRPAVVITRQTPAQFMAMVAGMGLPERTDMTIVHASSGLLLEGLRPPLILLDALDDVDERDSQRIVRALLRADVVVANATRETKLVTWLEEQSTTVTCRPVLVNPYLNTL